MPMRPSKRDNSVITCPGILGCSSVGLSLPKKVWDFDFPILVLSNKKKLCGIFVLYSKQEITIHLKIKKNSE